jgi:hypothetical protein
MQYALGLTAFMFALSTAFWGVIVAHLVDIIHQLSGDPVAGGFNITDANDLMNALVLINVGDFLNRLSIMERSIEL